MMGTRASPAVAETVSTISTLRRRTLRRGRAVFGALHCFSLAVHVGAIVGAFRFGVLLLLRGYTVARRGELKCEGWKKTQHALGAASIPIDVLPFQREVFARAHAGGESDCKSRPVVSLEGRRQECPGLLCTENPHFPSSQPW
jgi:hypothetical protein